MSELDNEMNKQTIGEFFNINDYIYNLTLRWRGLVKDDKGNIARISKPYARNSFILSQIQNIASAVNNHSVVANLQRDNTNEIILEKIRALILGCYKEGKNFNWDTFNTFVEEFDHTLQIFLTLPTDKHGSAIATALQAGVVAENTSINTKETTPQAKKLISGFLTKDKNYKEVDDNVEHF